MFNSVKIGQKVVVLADEGEYPIYDIDAGELYPSVKHHPARLSVGFITYTRDCLYWISNTNADPVTSNFVSRGLWLTRDQFVCIPNGASDSQIKALVHMLGAKDQ